MAAPAVYNVFVGAETGLLKGVDVDKNRWVNLNQLEAVDRQHEITSMCWSDDAHTQVCVASRNRTVSIYDTESQQFIESHHFPGGTGIIKGICKVNGDYVTAVESGLVKVWKEDDDAQLEIEVGEGLWRMQQNMEQHHLVATGGKENDLKIWDLQSPEQPIFKAKNVRNDWLNLRVPVWVMDMAFLPGTDKIVSVTGQHQLRVYDPSLPQRRPVVDVEFGEYPITSLGLRHGTNQVVIGNTHGKMALMDLRQGKMVQCYKGFAGSIRSIACHPTASVVASCGLDRYLRIHDIESRILLHKIYLKSRLNCLLLSEDWIQDENDEELAKSRKRKSQNTELDDGNSDTEGDSIWEKLQVVTDKGEKGPKSAPKEDKPSKDVLPKVHQQKSKKLKKKKEA